MMLPLRVMRRHYPPRLAGKSRQMHRRGFRRQATLNKPVKENVTGITVYFKSFIETYQKFDRWLSAADPVQAVEEEKKAAKANPDSLL